MKTQFELIQQQIAGHLIEAPGYVQKGTTRVIARQDPARVLSPPVEQIWWARRSYIYQRPVGFEVSRAAFYAYEGDIQRAMIVSEDGGGVYEHLGKDYMNLCYATRIYSDDQQDIDVQVVGACSMGVYVTTDAGVTTEVLRTESAAGGRRISFTLSSDTWVTLEIFLYVPDISELVTVSLADGLTRYITQWEAVDTTPPAAPTWTGTPTETGYLDVKSGAAKIILHWNKNTEADLAGYRIYRYQYAATGKTVYAVVDSTIQSNTFAVNATGETEYDITVYFKHNNYIKIAALGTPFTVSDTEFVHKNLCTNGDFAARSGNDFTGWAETNVEADVSDSAYTGVAVKSTATAGQTSSIITSDYIAVTATSAHTVQFATKLHSGTNQSQFDVLCYDAGSTLLGTLTFNKMGTDSSWITYAFTISQIGATGMSYIFPTGTTKVKLRMQLKTGTSVASVRSVDGILLQQTTERRRFSPYTVDTVWVQTAEALTGVNASDAITQQRYDGQFTRAANTTDDDTVDFTDNTVTAGTSYTYALAAFDKSGNVSTRSTTQTVTAGDSTAPGHVTIASYIPMYNGVQFTITLPADTDYAGVLIYNITGTPTLLGSKPFDVGSGGTTDTFVVGGLTKNTTYDLQLRAYDLHGNVNTTPTIPHQQFTTLSAPGDTDITISLSSADIYLKAGGYTITAVSASAFAVGTYPTVTAQDGGGNSMTVTYNSTVTEQYRWTYDLTVGGGATDGDGLIQATGTNAAGDDVSGVLPIVVDVTAPTNASFDATCYALDDRAYLFWSGASDATSGVASIKLWRYPDSDTPASATLVDQLDANATSYNDMYYDSPSDQSSLVGGRTYYYYLTVVDKAGNECTKSAGQALTLLPNFARLFRNYIDNSSFERVDGSSDPYSWTKTGTPSLATTGAYHGKRAAVVNYSSYYTCTYVYTDGSKDYVLSAYAKSQSSATLKLRFVVKFYKADGTQTGFTMTYDLPLYTSLSTSAYTRQTQAISEATIPNDAVSTSVSVQSDHATNNALVDGVQWEEDPSVGGTATAYMDSRVMTADRIMAQVIKTHHLEANTVIVSKLGSDATDRMFDTSGASDNVQGWAHATDSTKIDGGDIYANSITLSPLGATVTDRMFDTSGASDNVQGWAHATDSTKIDGGDIYANSITLSPLGATVTDRMFDTSGASDNVQGWAHATDSTKIDGGDIYANSITLSPLGATVTDRMFDTSGASDNVQGWAHATDSTKIDGGDIYTGTVTANKIAADTITAAQIAASTITATEMNISQLSAISADLGTITAGSITGVTVTSAASGSYVKLDAPNDQIELYNASYAGCYTRVKANSFNAGAVIDVYYPTGYTWLEILNSETNRYCNVGIDGSLDIDRNLTVGLLATAQTLESTVVTGTAPLVVASTTAVLNLNADLLDGSHSSAFAASSHNHAASAITSGTLLHERGGLEADVSAYSGLVKISGGATSSITDSSANWNTAYTHSQATTNVHGLTFTAEGTGGGLDADTVDASHASDFATSGHTHAQLHTQNTDTGTSQLVFTIDNDNVGAGTSTSLAFERGTTGADASLLWDESLDKFWLMIGSTATPARLDVASINGYTIAHNTHAQSHDHSAAGDGTSLNPATFNFPTSAPGSPVNGDAYWSGGNPVQGQGKLFIYNGAGPNWVSITLT